MPARSDVIRARRVAHHKRLIAMAELYLVQVKAALHTQHGAKSSREQLAGGHKRAHLDLQQREGVQLSGPR